MGKDYTNMLIDAIFADFTKEEREKIHVEHQQIAWPRYTSAHAFMPDLFYEEKARLCQGDTFDRITGTAIALARLRESILSYRTRIFEKQKRLWIPEHQEKWYSVELYGDHYEVVEHKGFTKVPANMVDLRQDMIFKTERAAKKWIRRKEMEGRHMYNQWKKRKCC